MATTYELPTAGDLAWVEDLICHVESCLDQIHSALKVPIDGNPLTQADPVTLEYLGRVFLLARTIREYAEGFVNRAGGLERAVVELRQLQEDDEHTLPDQESYPAWAQRHARQWADGAESAAGTLASAMRRKVEESDG